MSPGEKLESTVQDRSIMLCSKGTYFSCSAHPCCRELVCSCESRLKFLLGGMKLAREGVAVPGSSILVYFNINFDIKKKKEPPVKQEVT